MKKLLYFLVPFFLFSCVKLDNKKETSSIIKNSESDDITFIIDLKINQNTNEDLNEFVEEITQNVIDKEDFCLEYAYYISDDGVSVTLYEKHIDLSLIHI